MRANQQLLAPKLCPLNVSRFVEGSCGRCFKQQRFSKLSHLLLTPGFKGGRGGRGGVLQFLQPNRLTAHTHTQSRDPLLRCAPQRCRHKGTPTKPIERELNHSGEIPPEMGYSQRCVLLCCCEQLFMVKLVAADYIHKRHYACMSLSRIRQRPYCCICLPTRYTVLEHVRHDLPGVPLA